eukprot:3972883-Pyramimonas_sp.AAC.1
MFGCHRRPAASPSISDAKGQYWSLSAFLGDYDSRSVSWATVDSTVEDWAKPEDWNLCKRHYRDGVIEMQGDEGAFYMKPHVGGLMGDPFI